VKERPSRKTGTTITFWPDPEVFTDTVDFKYATVAQRLRELAFLNRGLRVRLTDKRNGSRAETFRYKGGLRDFILHLNSRREALHGRILYLEDEAPEAELQVALQWTNSFNENLISFANNINTHEGGTHEEGFRTALTKAVNEFARSKNLLKDKDPNLTGEDVREGLTAVVSVKVRNPQFDAGGPCTTGQFGRLLRRSRQRLLHENVLSGRDEAGGNVEVSVGGCAHDHGVDIRILRHVRDGGIPS